MVGEVVVAVVSNFRRGRSVSLVVDLLVLVPSDIEDCSSSEWHADAAAHKPKARRNRTGITEAEQEARAHRCQVEKTPRQSKDLQPNCQIYFVKGTSRADVDILIPFSPPPSHHQNVSPPSYAPRKGRQGLVLGH